MTGLEHPRQGIVVVSGYGACIGSSLWQDQASSSLEGWSGWRRHGLIRDSLPELLQSWVLDLSQLCEHVHPPLLERLLRLLRLRSLLRLNCLDVSLMRSRGLFDLRSCSGRHGVLVLINLREGLRIVCRPRRASELLDAAIHRGLNHLHDLQDPRLFSVVRC